MDAPPKVRFATASRLEGTEFKLAVLLKARVGVDDALSISEQVEL